MLGSFSFAKLWYHKGMTRTRGMFLSAFLCVLLFVCLFSFPAPAHATTAFTKRQTGVKNNATSGTTLTCTFASNPTPGDLITVGTNWFDDSGIATTMTVRDGNLNDYTVEPHDSGTTNVTTAGQVLQAYLAQAPSNASKSITITYSRTIVA